MLTFWYTYLLLFFFVFVKALPLVPQLGTGESGFRSSQLHDQEHKIPSPPSFLFPAPRVDSSSLSSSWMSPFSLLLLFEFFVLLVIAGYFSFRFVKAQYRIRARNKNDALALSDDDVDLELLPTNITTLSPKFKNVPVPPPSPGPFTYAHSRSRSGSSDQHIGTVALFLPAPMTVTRPERERPKSSLDFGLSSSGSAKAKQKTRSQSVGSSLRSRSTVLSSPLGRSEYELVSVSTSTTPYPQQTPLGAFADLSVTSPPPAPAPVSSTTNSASQTVMKDVWSFHSRSSYVHGNQLNLIDLHPAASSMESEPESGLDLELRAVEVEERVLTEQVPDLSRSELEQGRRGEPIHKPTAMASPSPSSALVQPVPYISTTESASAIASMAVLDTNDLLVPILDVLLVESGTDVDVDVGGEDKKGEDENRGMSIAVSIPIEDNNDKEDENGEGIIGGDGGKDGENYDGDWINQVDEAQAQARVSDDNDNDLHDVYEHNDVLGEEEKDVEAEDVAEGLEEVEEKMEVDGVDLVPIFSQEERPTTFVKVETGEEEEKGEEREQEESVATEAAGEGEDNDEEGVKAEEDEPDLLSLPDDHSRTLVEQEDKDRNANSPSSLSPSPTMQTPTPPATPLLQRRVLSPHIPSVLSGDMSLQEREGEHEYASPLSAWSLHTSDASPELGSGVSVSATSTSISISGSGSGLVGHIGAEVEPGNGEGDEEVKLKTAKGKEKESEVEDEIETSILSIPDPGASIPGMFPGDVSHLLEDENEGLMRKETEVKAGSSSSTSSSSSSSSSSISSASTRVTASASPTALTSQAPDQNLKRGIFSSIDVVLATQLRPGSLGPDPAWMVKFLMGWFMVLISGYDGFGGSRRGVPYVAIRRSRDGQ